MLVPHFLFSNREVEIPAVQQRRVPRLATKTACCAVSRAQLVTVPVHVTVECIATIYFQSLSCHLHGGSPLKNLNISIGMCAKVGRGKERRSPSQWHFYVHHFSKFYGMLPCGVVDAFVSAFKHG